ncbi:MAG: 50S ribosomal protein L23 [Candidatus Diapherotrites archaeon]|nr:50S ribosomal protein L23 [Candidatus Diapherotrites archaeon]
MKKDADKAITKEVMGKSRKKGKKEASEKLKSVVTKKEDFADKMVHEEVKVSDIADKRKNSEEKPSNFLDFMVRPLVSEKAVDMVEKENKITFITKKEVSKAKVKKLFEEEFKVKVDKVNIINDMRGQKKAIIKISKNYKASDIAMKLGLL